MGKPDEPADLALVDRLIFTPRGLILRRFTADEMRGRPTPDFKVFREGELVGYCEVKSPRDDWLIDLLDKAEPSEIVGGARDDPTFNRIARQISSSERQFGSVNVGRGLFNILVIVNHAYGNSFNDLRETVTGRFFGANGEVIQTVSHIPNRIIRDALMIIDLIGWIDHRTERVQGWMANDADLQRQTRAKALLGLP